MTYYKLNVPKSKLIQRQELANHNTSSDEVKVTPSYNAFKQAYKLMLLRGSLNRILDVLRASESCSSASAPQLGSSRSLTEKGKPASLLSLCPSLLL